MGGPLAEARTLDPQAGDRAAEGDRAELRHAHGHESVGKGCFDEVLVGRHAEHLGGAAYRVDLEHAVEGGDVETRSRDGRPGAKQVGGALLQPYRGPDGNCGVLPAHLSGESLIALAPVLAQVNGCIRHGATLAPTGP